MMNKRLLALLSFALFLAPVASAQEVTGVTVTGTDEARTISATAPTTIPFTVTIGCGEFLDQQAQSLDVSLTTDLPDYYAATSAGEAFAPGPNCLTGSGTLTQSVDLVLTPTANATGHDPLPFTVTATAGSATSEPFTHEETIQIEYVPGHTLEPSIQFPYEMTEADNGVLEFDVVVRVQANTDTMVMFEQVGSTGTLSGIGHQVFQITQGDARERTLKVTYKAPEFAWQNDTISFHNYSHCLKGSPCDAQMTQDIEWDIVNMASGPVNGGGGGDDGKDSPGVGAGILVIGLVGVALLARRRS